jgi:hypothetical protein
MLELNIGFHNKVNMPNDIINAFSTSVPAAVQVQPPWTAQRAPHQ